MSGVERASAERVNASNREPVELLERGRIELLGVLPYASNYTYLAQVRDGDRDVAAVYKPRRGERPLWDFASGTLGRREVAAYVLSVGAGWDLVPPTVFRGDAPLGEGSLQLFIDHDPDRHYLTLAESRLADFVSFVAFDVITNNADRKSGHVLEDTSGHLWGVDHGLTFHVEPKLRTVIWEFAGRELPPGTRTLVEASIDALAGDPGAQIAHLLSDREVAAAGARAQTLLAAGRFPAPEGGRYPLPWPMV